MHIIKHLLLYFRMESCESPESPTGKNIAVAGIAYSARLIKHAFDPIL